MKAIHFILGLLLYLALAAGALAVMASPVRGDCLQAVLGWARGLPPWGRVALGAGGLLYLGLFWLSGLRWRKPKAFVAFDNENGRIAVNVDAVQAYLNGLKDEFAAVTLLKSRLQVNRGALAIGLVLGVREGTRIPELCKLIQSRVKDILEEHLGTCDLRGVAIEVNEIRAGKKTAGDSE